MFWDKRFEMSRAKLGRKADNPLPAKLTVLKVAYEALMRLD